MNNNDKLMLLIRAQIVTAFLKQSYPGDRNIVADSGDFDPECDAVRKAFIGKRWMDVSVEMVRTFKDALPLFTPAAFAYFLPAYMLASIDAPHEVDTALDSVIFNLTPPKSRRGWKWAFFHSRASLFDRAQADAIKAFLDREAQLEVEEWAPEGKSPPPDRIGRALAYWTQVLINNLNETRKT